MSRLVLLVAVAAVSLLCAASAGASPSVHAAGKCHLSGHDQRHSGASYLTSLSVKHTSCSTGKAVVRAFNACRHASGGAGGHCHHRVKGYSCSEHRAGISVQYDSTTNCSRGSRRVHFTYTQNT